MKKIKILLSSLILLSISYASNSQSLNEASFHSKDGRNLHRYLSDEIEEVIDFNELHELCINSVTFVRFQIDRSGTIKNISFTENSPEGINKAFRKAIESTNGLWKPRTVEGKPIESSFIVLPVVYFLEVACEVQHRNTHDLFGTSLLNMLNYEDSKGEIEQLHCTILKPFIITSTK